MHSFRFSESVLLAVFLYTITPTALSKQVLQIASIVIKPALTDPEIVVPPANIEPSTPRPEIEKIPPHLPKMPPIEPSEAPKIINIDTKSP